jgi:predicted thioesterase
MTEGQQYSETYQVSSEDTADALGNNGVKVLSTPDMIRLMETTATKIIDQALPEGYRPVGTSINVDHMNPAFVGEEVLSEAIIESIEGQKIYYHVKVTKDDQVIGEGTYVQHMIRLASFLKNNPL